MSFAIWYTHVGVAVGSPGDSWKPPVTFVRKKSCITGVALMPRSW